MRGRSRGCVVLRRDSRALPMMVFPTANVLLPPARSRAVRAVMLPALRQGRDARRHLPTRRTCLDGARCPGRWGIATARRRSKGSQGQRRLHPLRCSRSSGPTKCHGAGTEIDAVDEPTSAHPFAGVAVAAVRPPRPMPPRRSRQRATKEDFEIIQGKTDGVRGLRIQVQRKRPEVGRVAWGAWVWCLGMGANRCR